MSRIPSIGVSPEIAMSVGILSLRVGDKMSLTCNTVHLKGSSIILRLPQIVSGAGIIGTPGSDACHVRTIGDMLWCMKQ